MPRYEARCPECGHSTEVVCSVQAWRDMQPIACACGATKRQVIHAPALSRDRKTQGKPRT